MNTSDVQHRWFTRLETDKEFRVRLVAAGRNENDVILGTQQVVMNNGGDWTKAYDDWAWLHCRMQRRIIEVGS